MQTDFKIVSSFLQWLILMLKYFIFNYFNYEKLHSYIT